MLKRLIILLLLAAPVLAQNLMPPAMPVRYHAITIVHGATLLKTKLVVAPPIPMILMTWIQNYVTTNEVTCIDASPDLSHWTLVFTGATNQWRFPAPSQTTFWRAYNILQ